MSPKKQNWSKKLWQQVVVVWQLWKLLVVAQMMNLKIPMLTWINQEETIHSTKRRSLLSEDVAAALDRLKVTDHQAVHLLAATAHSLGHDVNNITISCSSIHRARSANREKNSKEIKASFSPQVPLTVHCDGKLLPDLTGQEKVDRLPVIVTGNGVYQNLSLEQVKHKLMLS